jgi:hypothetical protein
MQVRLTKSFRRTNSILDRSDQRPINLVRMQVLAECPFGQKAPVFVAHKHFRVAACIAVFFGKFDSRDRRLRLTGVLGESSATLDDCPSIALAYDHISKVEHERFSNWRTDLNTTIEVCGSFPLHGCFWTAGKFCRFSTTFSPSSAHHCLSAIKA